MVIKLKKRLYGFYPDGHGPLSFFVVAGSEEEARKAINKFVADHPPLYREEWPQNYEVEVVDAGQVLVNDNS